MADNEALYIEKTHVYEVYDKIATHFSETRYKPWQRVLDFVQALPQGSLLIDVGCGNGKYLGHNKLIAEIGCDRSLSLNDICRDRGLESLCCDILSLPFRSGVADAFICIAVIHHLATNERRLKALQELVKLLQPGGLGLIYVWSMEQKIGNSPTKYIKEAKETLRSSAEIQESPCSSGGIANLPIHVNRTQFQSQDVLVPWHKKGKRGNKAVSSDEPSLCHRYYHVFQKGELDELCSQLQDADIKNSYYDQGNWCIILQKK